MQNKSLLYNSEVKNSIMMSKTENDCGIENTV